MRESGSAEAMANRNPSKHRLHSPRHTSVKLYACDISIFVIWGSSSLLLSVSLFLSALAALRLRLTIKQVFFLLTLPSIGPDFKKLLGVRQ